GDPRDPRDPLADVTTASQLQVARQAVRRFGTTATEFNTRHRRKGRGPRRGRLPGHRRRPAAPWTARTPPPSETTVTPTPHPIGTAPPPTNPPPPPATPPRTGILTAARRPQHRNPERRSTSGCKGPGPARPRDRAAHGARRLPD